MTVGVVIQLMKEFNKMLTRQAKNRKCIWCHERWQIRRSKDSPVSAGAPNGRVPDGIISQIGLL